MSLIEGLQDCIDSVLGIRDDIGAVLKPVYLVIRTWSGSVPGEGSYSDSEEQVLPSPYVVELNHSLRLMEGGAVKQGDVILKMISKSVYPLESSLDGKSTSRNIEKFYKIGEVYYQVISIKDNYLTWDVQVRRVSFSGR
jgi:hypothetical protein